MDDFRSHQSGAEATALQTLARPMTTPTGAKRLDCGVFTAAFVRTTRYRTYQNLCPRESGFPGLPLCLWVCD